MMNGIKIISSLLLFLNCACAFSESILFEFSGRFGACMGEELLTLDQQLYSGTLLIPSSATVREPDTQNSPFSNDEIWSYYELSGSQARLSFDTIGTNFDVVDGTPIDTIVGYCKTSFCAPNENFVWFQFIRDTYTFTLNFGGLPNPGDRSTKIPGVAGYSAFSYREFGIHKNEGYPGILTNEISPLETEMEISISAVCAPSVQVPHGPLSSFVFASFVCSHGVFRLHCQQSNSMRKTTPFSFLRARRAVVG